MKNRKPVLVVDDDRDLRDTLAEVLEGEGYPVRKACDGLEALDVLRGGEEPGLILLDSMMPRCDGAQFREKQENDPAIAHIPVVLLTADTRMAANGPLVHAQDYLPKPVQLEQLLAVVEKYCT